MKKQTIFKMFIFIFLLLSLPTNSADMPDQLKNQFKDPPPTFRPLQIIHGFDNLASLQNPNARSALLKALEELKKLGLGGVVCNVGFRDYMRDENQWKLFGMGLDTCKELGLRVWIYDEDGYPSGSAGGLVLEKNPTLEAQELILDPTSETHYLVRPAYEGTHACNNYYMARRYPNIIDAEADRTFVELTHENYARRFRSYFGSLIEAFFTDEPSLIACSLGQIPESVRKSVTIRDPLDPNVQRLPSVPWVHDLPQLFLKEYGYDVTKKINSLFGGDSEADKKVRCDFWALVSRLVQERYFSTIKMTCRQFGVASSGHTLGEESLVQHLALNGNSLRNLQAMDIPGIDILSSNPANAFGGYAVTGSVASSAALLNGTRRVMTETSDHSEQMNKRSATLEEMCATAAWQFALGITDFNLYYGRNRAPGEYKRYCDYVGRLGTLLTPAKRVVRVALYYPIYDLWSGYRPTAEPLTPKTQPELEQKIAQSFSDACSQLLREGVSFCWVDHNHLAEAILKGKRIEMDHAVFDAVVVPLTDQIPEAAQKKLNAFQKAGCTIIHFTQPNWKEKIRPYKAADVTTEQAGCLVSRFERDNSTFLLFVNTTPNPWKGVLTIPQSAKAMVWHFSDGTVTELSKNNFNKNSIEINLISYESVMVLPT